MKIKYKCFNLQIPKTKQTLDYSYYEYRKHLPIQERNEKDMYLYGRFELP